MLEVQNVGKDFEGLQALDSVSLNVNQGEIVGLIGPNGSGKSTLINVISGMIPVSRGQIIFDHQDITHLSPDQIFQQGLGRGFQDPSLFLQLTVLDNALLPIQHQIGEKAWLAPLKHFWQAQEIAHAQQTGQILERLNLLKLFRQRASDISGGQMKLLDIGRSLMGKPKMMLLDEPTAGVAPKLAHDIFTQLEALRHESGIGFLIVEHRLEILFNFVDRLYVMHLGNILAEGTPAEISANPQVREVYLGN